MINCLIINNLQNRVGEWPDKNYQDLNTILNQKMLLSVGKNYIQPLKENGERRILKTEIR